MKRLLVLAISLTSPIIAYSQGESQKASFGIYLTQLPASTIQQLERNPIVLESVPLEPIPLISEKDLIEYTFKTHTMKLTTDGFERISKIKVGSVSVGIPFVVVANGNKAYMGMFWSMASSIPTKYPHIDPMAKEMAEKVYGCSTCIGINPPSVDERVRPYMALKALGLIKDF